MPPRTPQTLKSIYFANFIAGSTVYRWSLAEISKLKETVASKQPGTTWELVAKGFPGRSMASVINKWHLGGARSKDAYWSEQEVSKLKALRAEGKLVRDLVEEFPGRSEAAIKSKVYRNSISRGTV